MTVLTGTPSEISVCFMFIMYNFSEHKAEVINELASINKLNLSEIQEKLVHRWLNEGEAVSDAFAVNLDDVFLFIMSIFSFLDYGLHFYAYNNYRNVG